MEDKKEAIRSIQYWWKERGDIERWIGWEANKENFLGLHALLEIKDYLNKTIDHVVQKLGEEK